MNEVNKNCTQLWWYNKYNISWSILRMHLKRKGGGSTVCITLYVQKNDIWTVEENHKETK